MSLMSVLTRLVVHNWQVKVVAFFLAVALWLYTSGQARIERTLQVHITDSAVRSLPGDYQITEITPREFRVDIDGPSTLLGDLSLDVVQPSLVIAADALAQGHQTFPISERILGLPGDVRLQRINPENLREIRVAFGRIVEGQAGLLELEVIEVPEGLDVTVSVKQGLVRMRGPQAVIDEYTRSQPAPLKIGFEPLRLGSIDPATVEPTTFEVELTPRPPPNVAILSTVEATVTVTPRSSVRKLETVPVNLLVPHDFFQLYRVELSASQVSVPVHGPQNLLRLLKPGDLTVYLALPRDIEPDVATEGKLTVISRSPAYTFDEVTVRYTVRVVAARPTPPVPAPEPDEPRP